MIAALRLRTVIWFTATIAIVIGGCALLLFSAPSPDKHLSVYSVVSNYSLPVVERGGQDYVGLLEALEPVGVVSATAEGTHWRLRYNNQPVEFTAASNHCRVRQSDFDLHSNFLLENGRGLVPLSTFGALLSRILGGPVAFHEASRRAFIGSVGVHFTAQVNKETPRSLVMNFTSPVNPMIATEPGKLHMVFSHEPVLAPGSPSLTFDDKIIPSANFAEDNGAAEITINSTAPLFASFSNGNRTITITPKPATQAALPPATTPTLGGPASAPGQTSSAPGQAAPPLAAPVFAIVDASHGGDERGEALTDQLAEKDITLAFARALRQELQNRGISATVLRDGDATLTPDQRAIQTNVAHPAIYICLHASSQGRGVRLYTALLPSGGSNAGPFLSWETAQSPFLPLSRTAAAGLALELQKQQIAVRVLIAPLRPLNNIATAAVAVEVAPPAGGIPDLNSSAYQQMVARGVASGVLSLRGQLEAAKQP